MAAPKTRGRMITKDISDSKGFASLSPEAAVLFCMLIPHYNSHGKMNGAPGYVKAEVCPRIPFLTEKKIASALAEISEHTSVKWFEHDGRYWIHSIHFLGKHQALTPEKLGSDLLPSYSGVSPGLVHHEVEVEVEVEGEEEGEGNSELPSDPSDASRRTSPAESFKDAWNRSCPSLPKAMALSKTRRAKIQVRLAERGLAEWEGVFQRIERSAFCKGSNDRGWKATFDWILENTDNALKVMEGKYDDRAPAGSPPRVYTVPKAVAQ